MTTVPDLLALARDGLAVAQDNLSQAVKLAQARHYNGNWVAAIDKARAHNSETHRQVANIVTNIRPLK